MGCAKVAINSDEWRLLLFFPSRLPGALKGPPEYKKKRPLTPVDDTPFEQ